MNLYYRVRNHLWYIWLRFPTSVAVRRTVGYLAFDLVESTYRHETRTWARAVRDAWRHAISSATTGVLFRAPCFAGPSGTVGACTCACCSDS